MEGESMDPKTERKLQKTITKLNITPEDLKEFLKSTEAEDEEVNKLVEEANSEKEEPKNESADGPEAKQEKEEPAKETKQEESAPETDPAKQEKEAEPEQKPDEAKAKEEADKKEEAPAPKAEEQADEYKKAIEGLNAKFDGLIDSLTKAGFLTQERQQVGAESENLPANDVGKGTQSAIDAINKGRSY